MIIAWTTVATRADADHLASSAVSQDLAACVQIEGPVSSLYKWKGQLEHAEEFRLTFKCLPDCFPALEALVFHLHPYDTPEWLAVRAERVGEKYLSWARANSTTPPL